MGRPFPHKNPEIISRQKLRGVDHRFYEGGDTIPRPGTYKRDLLHKYRERLQPTLDIPVSIPGRFTELALGRIETEQEEVLPVFAYKETIINSVANNQITIITAETGAGKSTQVPQYLVENGYTVNMTQPRRISASFVAEEMQRQINDVLGEDGNSLIACHTAETNTTVDGKTRITVLTDGLRLVQEFGSRDELENEVLIIDEVHEWNANIEMLVAQVKRLIKQKPELRVVIMSATMEAQKLAEYFADGSESILPPIIEIPGRNYGVERIDEPESDVVAQALKSVGEGENVLIFLPGVREIQDTMSALHKQLQKRGILDVTILPLHSKLSQREQEQVKGQYAGPKIICATNIAQTSITIPDINVVVDSGLERRMEIDKQGVQSLNLRHISRADMDQRAGRTGRVAPGRYILTKLNRESPFVSYGDKSRTDYPIAEILRTDIDRNTLIAAAAGIDITELELFHPVDEGVIDRSKAALLLLGALGENGKITKRGERMARLPMRPRYARMFIATEDMGRNVRQQAAAMVAAMEVGGMPSWLQDRSREWRSLSDQTDSDHIVQLDIFNQAHPLDWVEQRQLGLDVRNVERAQELYRKVCKHAKLPVTYSTSPLTLDEREQLRSAVVTGLIDYVYEKRGFSEYVRVGGKSHTLRTKTDRSTVVGSPGLVVATPYGIERDRGVGHEVEHVIQDITAITRRHLGELGAALCDWGQIETQWRGGRLKQIQKQLFRHTIETGLILEQDAVPSKESINEVKQYVLRHSGTALTALKAVKNNLEKLQRLTTERLPRITQEDLEAVIDQAIDGMVLNPSHVDQRIREIMDEQNIYFDALIAPSEYQKIVDNSPTLININEKAFKLSYRRGVPRLYIDDLATVHDWTGEITLPDGREIEIVFDRHIYSLTEIRRLANNG